MRVNAEAPDAAHMATELVALHKELGAQHVEPGGATIDGIWPRNYVVTLSSNVVIFVTLEDTKGGFRGNIDYVWLSLHAKTKGSTTPAEQRQLAAHFDKISSAFRRRYEVVQQEVDTTASTAIFPANPLPLESSNAQN